MNIFKRSMVFVTFFGCCFCLALLAASLGTRYWFVASCRQRFVPIPSSVSQIMHKTSDSERTLDSVTSDGKKMANTVNLGTNDEKSVRNDGDVVKSEDVASIGPEFRPNSTGFINFGLFHGDKGLNVGFGERISQFDVSSTAGLLQEGLWAGTIACLSAALLFVVLGAVFAVINTVITPVEAITGITGLYIWNSLAAAFELVAVILWSVQYSTRLVENVLILDSKGGWTTEGNESLGYSFWLVVVAMVVHIANCGLIGFGTYEPKLKEKIQEPDKVTNDILLY
uniref:Clarin-2-like n=1 Tax=Hirondellea gigas TaxID=1518452 RepID=A0A2P2HWR9_9CRUS